MKLNFKMYKKIENEPFLTQNIDGKKVDFHYMDDTPFLFQYASKGRFAIWASDGNNYKVIIESKYYETMKDFYSEKVNQIWIRFLERVGSINQKVTRMFIIPVMILFAAVAFITSMFFEEYLTQVFLGLLVVIIVTNVFQNKNVSKKVREENLNAQNEIRNLLGNKRFEELIQDQQSHYEEYFKFEDEDQSEEIQENVEPKSTEEVEVVEKEDKE